MVSLFLSMLHYSKDGANSTGFAVVGEYEDQKIQDAQKEAFQQILGFLNEH